MKSLEIIKTLLPTLKLAGEYACNIQSQIQTQPEKDYQRKTMARTFMLML
ncbi:hypothetical protein [Cyanobacterium aponinum]|nr:hypothetical protein [Cyanobacterium aponinum]